MSQKKTTTIVETCDRCDATATRLENQSRKFFEAQVPASPSMNYTTAADLCPNCFSGLKIWWQNGRSHRGGAEDK